MRVFLLWLPLLLAACVRQEPSVTPVPQTIMTAIEVIDEEGPPSRHFPDSPFLLAVAKAGLIKYEQMYVDSIDLCGMLSLGGNVYYVLYVDRYQMLGRDNRRGGSYWLVCDTAMNPVWMNPDWGGKPGRCFNHQILVDLHSKMFEVNDDIGSCGDLITYRLDGGALKASISWSSDEVRVACMLNAAKWRIDSHEPDEVVAKLVPVAGHPKWRIALTRYDGTSQGCAKLIAETNDGDAEFGVRELACLFSDQACRPTNVWTASLPWGGKALFWIDWQTRSGFEYRTVGVLRADEWEELLVVHR